MMAPSSPIQLDTAFIFLQAALAETRRTLCRTHGEAFAAYFMDEHRDCVLKAAKTRLCGRSEPELRREVEHLKGRNTLR